jgi:hypothetical protein
MQYIWTSDASNMSLSDRNAPLPATLACNPGLDQLSTVIRISDEPFLQLVHTDPNQSWMLLLYQGMPKLVASLSSTNCDDHAACWATAASTSKDATIAASDQSVSIIIARCRHVPNVPAAELCFVSASLSLLSQS